LAQETELKKQIDEEKARSQEIDDMEAYVGTDEYVEEIAKEKLGLVNENEIILKAK
jgi:cell division protein DivIC